MAATYKHDPLTAISEAEATGEIAVCFADIRSTMQLPLLTSIWRTLAGVEGGLQTVWSASKPLFASGFPDSLLTRFQNPSLLPVPSESALVRLKNAGLSRESLEVIQGLVDVYTRSNSLNLLVLTALFANPTDQLEEEKPTQRAIEIPELPRLLEPHEIEPATWRLLLDINEFGASPDEPGLATLWRHLAHWPEALSVLYDALLPLQKNGVISRSIEQVLEVAQAEGSRLATLRPLELQAPEVARLMIKKYVTHPGLVARMVAIGNGLSIWLRSDTGITYG